MSDGRNKRTGSGRRRAGAGDNLKSPAFSPGQEVGEYIVDRHLGHGGMGDVYLVHTRLAHVQRVLKILHEKYTAEPQHQEQFNRAAGALAKVEYDGVVRVFGGALDPGSGRPYLVLEPVLIEGDGGVPESFTLLDALRDGAGFPVSSATAAALMVQVCASLEAVHRRSIIHMDLKPANLLLTSRDLATATVKIADFGLARIAGEDDFRSAALESMSDSMGRTRPRRSGHTGASTYARQGTWDYMSPEVRDGQPGTFQSDIYALGLIMYNLLSGTTDTRTNPGELARIEVEVGGHWRAIIERCIESDPKKRPADALAVARELAPGEPFTSLSDLVKVLRNLCPVCGRGNRRGAEWCAFCSDASLIRYCPECREPNPVQRTICGSCGTNSRHFDLATHTRNVLSRLRDERKWREIVRQGEHVKPELLLPGKEGRKLLDEIKQITDEARARLDEIGRKRESILDAVAREDYRAAHELRLELEQDDPHELFEPSAVWLERAAAVRECQETLDGARARYGRRELSSLEAAMPTLATAIGDLEPPGPEWDKRLRDLQQAAAALSQQVRDDLEAAAAARAAAAEAAQAGNFEGCGDQAARALALNREDPEAPELRELARREIEVFNALRQEIDTELAEIRRQNTDSQLNSCLQGIARLEERLDKVRAPGGRARGQIDEMRTELQRLAESARGKVRTAVGCFETARTRFRKMDYPRCLRLCEKALSLNAEAVEAAELMTRAQEVMDAIDNEWPRVRILAAAGEWGQVREITRRLLDLGWDKKKVRDYHKRAEEELHGRGRRRLFVFLGIVTILVTCVGGILVLFWTMDGDLRTVRLTLDRRDLPPVELERCGKRLTRIGNSFRFKMAKRLMPLREYSRKAFPKHTDRLLPDVQSDHARLYRTWKSRQIRLLRKRLAELDGAVEAMAMQDKDLDRVESRLRDLVKKSWAWGVLKGRYPDLKEQAAAIQKKIDLKQRRPMPPAWQELRKRVEAAVAGAEKGFTDDTAFIRSVVKGSRAYTHFYNLLPAHASERLDEATKDVDDFEKFVAVLRSILEQTKLFQAVLSEVSSEFPDSVRTQWKTAAETALEGLRTSVKPLVLTDLNAVLGRVKRLCVQVKSTSKLSARIRTAVLDALHSGSSGIDSGNAATKRLAAARKALDNSGAGLPEAVGASLKALLDGAGRAVTSLGALQKARGVLKQALEALECPASFDAICDRAEVAKVLERASKVESRLMDADLVQQIREGADNVSLRLKPINEGLLECVKLLRAVDDRIAGLRQLQAKERFLSDRRTVLTSLREGLARKGDAQAVVGVLGLARTSLNDLFERIPVRPDDSAQWMSDCRDWLGDWKSAAAELKEWRETGLRSLDELKRRGVGLSVRLRAMQDAAEVPSTDAPIVREFELAFDSIRALTAHRDAVTDLWRLRRTACNDSTLGNSPENSVRLALRAWRSLKQSLNQARAKALKHSLKQPQAKALSNVLKTWALELYDLELRWLAARPGKPTTEDYAERRGWLLAAVQDCGALPKVRIATGVGSSGAPLVRVLPDAFRVVEGPVAFSGDEFKAVFPATVKLRIRERPVPTDLVLRLMRPGRSPMGGRPRASDETGLDTPRFQVEVSRPFYVSAPIRLGELRAFERATNRAVTSGDARRIATGQSYARIMAFCRWLSRKGGVSDCIRLVTADVKLQFAEPSDWRIEFGKEGFRLPSEIEWEYVWRTSGDAARDLFPPQNKHVRNPFTSELMADWLWKYPGDDGDGATVRNTIHGYDGQSKASDFKLVFRAVVPPGVDPLAAPPPERRAYLPDVLKESDDSYGFRVVLPLGVKWPEGKPARSVVDRIDRKE